MGVGRAPCRQLSPDFISYSQTDHDGDGDDDDDDALMMMMWMRRGGVMM